MPPIEYFLRLKIQKATQLLSLTGLSIKEVAASIGISDPYYFSRLFKKMTGSSPSAYRSIPKGWTIKPKHLSILYVKKELESRFAAFKLPLRFLIQLQDNFSPRMSNNSYRFLAELNIQIMLWWMLEDLADLINPFAPSISKSITIHSRSEPVDSGFKGGCQRGQHRPWAK